MVFCVCVFFFTLLLPCTELCVRTLHTCAHGSAPLPPPVHSSYFLLFPGAGGTTMNSFSRSGGGVRFLLPSRPLVGQSCCWLRFQRLRAPRVLLLVCPRGEKKASRAGRAVSIYLQLYVCHVESSHRACHCRPVVSWRKYVLPLDRSALNFVSSRLVSSQRRPAVDSIRRYLQVAGSEKAHRGGRFRR